MSGHRLPRRWRRLGARFGTLLPSVGVALALASSAGRAAPIAPDVPSTVRVGRAEGAFPELPSRRIRELGRRQLSPIRLATSMADDGAIWAGDSVDGVIVFEPDGRVRARVSISPSSVAAPILPLAHQTGVVLTEEGKLHFLAPDLRITRTASILDPVATRPAAFLYSAMADVGDGSVFVVFDTIVARVQSSGGVSRFSPLPRSIAGPLAPHAGGWLTLLADGEVWWHGPSGARRRMGSFGPDLRTSTFSVLPGGQAAVAARDGRLLRLDLRTRRLTTFRDVPGRNFDSPLIGHADGTVWATTDEGALLRLGVGAEGPREAVIERTSSAPRSRALGTPRAHKIPLAPYLDPTGRVATARDGGRISVFAPDGRALFVTDRGCDNVRGIHPVADKRVVVVCAEGTWILYGEAPSKD